MARSLSDILATLDSGYAPSRNNINTQIGGLGSAQEADLSSLKATADQAKQDILTGAQRRGLGFSGIPVGEQAKYDATSYMPAVAKLKQSYVGRAASLDEALNSLNREQNAQAQSIYQTELARDEQIRQFEQGLAAQRATASANAATSTPDIGKYLTALTGNTQKTTTPSYSNDANGGFQFRDANGKPISAVAYAKLVGTSPITILQKMAQAGDAGATKALRAITTNKNYNMVSQDNGLSRMSDVINAYRHILG